MNQSSNTDIFCPVPSEQQPVNEYLELSESSFFRWVTLSKRQFASKFIWLWIFSLLISSPIAAASFSPRETPFSFSLSSGLGASLVLAFFLIRLYLGWSYIGDRLRKTKIVYEESSWYDGQIWEKPLEFYRRDQLIFQYQVQPILRRLYKSMMVLGGLMGSGLLVLLWLISH